MIESDNNHPSVFISSTISDFADLRSALGYYLERSGYRVFMSESNSFPVNPNQTNFDQCFDLIDQCQYYILLVGYSRGSWFKESRTTITEEEFLRARSRFESTGDISIITFVRQDVWTATREYKRSGFSVSNSQFEDIEFTARFLDEVTKDDDFSRAQRSEGNYPKGAWVSRFNRFSDIIDVLSMTLRLNTNRRLEMLRALALDEIVENIRNCFDDYTKSREAFPYFNMLTSISASSNLKGTQVPAKEARWYSHVGFMGLASDKFKTQALRDLLSSGELLEYNIDTKLFQKSKLMRIAEVAFDEISRVQRYFQQTNFGVWGPKLKRLSDQARNMKPDDMIDIPEDLFTVLWMVARTERIFHNSWVLYQALRFPNNNIPDWLDRLGSEFFHVITVSGEEVGPVPLNKVQEWFNMQGYHFEE